MKTTMIARALPLLLLLLAVSAPMLGGCSSTAGAYCAKEKECCDVMGTCERWGKEGADERCELNVNEMLDTFRTFDDSLCDDIADLYEDVMSCAADVTCEQFKSKDACRSEQEALTAAIKTASNNKSCQ